MSACYGKIKVINIKGDGMKATKIIKRTLAILIYSLIAFIFLFFFWRIYTNDHDPKAAKNIVWDGAMTKAYEKSPETFKVYTQKISDYITPDGYFSVGHLRYFDSVSKLQLTLKYNRSTLKYLKEAYSLSESPNDPWIFVLCDKDGSEISVGTECAFAKYALYRYHRITFDNVDLDGYATLTLKVYYKENYDSDDKKPFGELGIYTSQTPLEEYDFSDELPF